MLSQLKPHKHFILILAILLGLTADLAADRTLADALVYAQTHDPDFDDGRLRDAYPADAFIGTEAKVQAALAPPGFQKGMSYAAWWQGLYSTPEADQALAKLAATGAEWLALIVTCYQETYLHTAITCNLPRTPTDDDLIHTIQTAHGLGLKVMLKPHIDLNNDPNHWRGDIGQGFTRETEWQAWFASYQAVIRHYATLAQTHGVEQFSVGTELVGTSPREADWRQVIAAVRGVYSGPLVYASNHSGEEGRITWWDAVDYIGVDAYYPLTAKDDPTLTELKAGWEQLIATLEALHNRYGKPIILTEIGYRSMNGANRQPWEWAAPGVVDLQEQADCYQAALESLWGRPWLAGIYWWNWDTDPEQGGPNDTGFTPHNKPAELVLQAFYKSTYTLYLPTVVKPPCHYQSTRPRLQGTANFAGEVKIRTPNHCTTGLPTQTAIIVSGTYTGTPANVTLWVLAYAPNSRYYIQSPNACAGEPPFQMNGQWQAPAYLGLRGGSPEWFDLVVILGSEEASQFLSNRVQQECQSGIYTGIPGVQLNQKAITEKGFISVQTVD